MDRTCGSCTMCCRATGVPELNKPVNVWCSHCNIGKGCAIYAIRPQSCRSFECRWLSDKTLPESLRPDRCKVIFEKLGEFKIYLAMVARGYKDVWQEQSELTGLIQQILREGNSIAITTNGSSERHILLAEGQDSKEVIKDIEQYAKQAGVLGKAPDGGSSIQD